MTAFWHICNILAPFQTYIVFCFGWAGSSGQSTSNQSKKGSQKRYTILYPWNILKRLWQKTAQHSLHEIPE